MSLSARRCRLPPPAQQAACASTGNDPWKQQQSQRMEARHLWCRRLRRGGAPPLPPWKPGLKGVRRKPSPTASQPQAEATRGRASEAGRPHPQPVEVRGVQRRHRSHRADHAAKRRRKNELPRLHDFPRGSSSTGLQLDDGAFSDGCRTSTTPGVHRPQPARPGLRGQASAWASGCRTMGPPGTRTSSSAAAFTSISTRSAVPGSSTEGQCNRRPSCGTTPAGGLRQARRVRGSPRQRSCPRLQNERERRPDRFPPAVLPAD